MFDNNLSIIVLTHNSLDNTKKFISNLYSYTPVSFELVLLDNGSTDGTIEYLQELSEKRDNIVFRANKKNEGVIKGRNKAYSMSNASMDYVIFLDNDQYVQKNWLDSYEKCFQRGYDIVGIEAWKMRNDFMPMSRIRDDHASFQYVGCGGMAIKTKIIKEIGLFDERYCQKFYEDPDFCWRAAGEGYKIGWNNKPVIIHDHEGPLLNNETRKYFYENLNRFRKKWKGRKVPVFKMERDK
tara:strand:+ start:23269 stop:23985 length:717 start_codon:yes stop_codon:yes gene_type:complete